MAGPIRSTGFVLPGDGTPSPGLGRHSPGTDPAPGGRSLLSDRLRSSDSHVDVTQQRQPDAAVAAVGLPGPSARPWTPTAGSAFARLSQSLPNAGAHPWASGPGEVSSSIVTPSVPVAGPGTSHGLSSLGGSQASMGSSFGSVLSDAPIHLSAAQRQTCDRMTTLVWNCLQLITPDILQNALYQSEGRPLRALAMLLTFSDSLAAAAAEEGVSAATLRQELADLDAEQADELLMMSDSDEALGELLGVASAPPGLRRTSSHLLSGEEAGRRSPIASTAMSRSSSSGGSASLGGSGRYKHPRGSRSSRSRRHSPTPIDAAMGLEFDSFGTDTELRELLTDTDDTDLSVALYLDSDFDSDDDDDYSPDFSHGSLSDEQLSLGRRSPPALRDGAPIQRSSLSASSTEGGGLIVMTTNTGGSPTAKPAGPLPGACMLAHAAAHAHPHALNCPHIRPPGSGWRSRSKCRMVCCCQVEALLHQAAAAVPDPGGMMQVATPPQPPSAASATGSLFARPFARYRAGSRSRSRSRSRSSSATSTGSTGPMGGPLSTTGSTSSSGSLPPRRRSSSFSLSSFLSGSSAAGTPSSTYEHASPATDLTVGLDAYASGSRASPAPPSGSPAALRMSKWTLRRGVSSTSTSKPPPSAGVPVAGNPSASGATAQPPATPPEDLLRVAPEASPSSTLSPGAGTLAAEASPGVSSRPGAGHSRESGFMRTLRNASRSFEILFLGGADAPPGGDAPAGEAAPPGQLPVGVLDAGLLPKSTAVLSNSFEADIHTLSADALLPGAEPPSSHLSSPSSSGQTSVDLDFQRAAQVGVFAPGQGGLRHPAGGDLHPTEEDFLDDGDRHSGGVFSRLIGTRPAAFFRRRSSSQLALSTSPSTAEESPGSLGAVPRATPSTADRPASAHLLSAGGFASPAEADSAAASSGALAAGRRRHRISLSVSSHELGSLTGTSPPTSRPPGLPVTPSMPIAGSSGSPGAAVPITKSASPGSRVRVPPAGAGLGAASPSAGPGLRPLSATATSATLGLSAISLSFAAQSSRSQAIHDLFLLELEYARLAEQVPRQLLRPLFALLGMVGAEYSTAAMAAASAAGPPRCLLCRLAAAFEAGGPAARDPGCPISSLGHSPALPPTGLQAFLAMVDARSDEPSPFHHPPQGLLSTTDSDMSVASVHSNSSSSSSSSSSAVGDAAGPSRPGAHDCPCGRGLTLAGSADLVDGLRDIFDRAGFLDRTLALRHAALLRLLGDHLVVCCAVTGRRLDSASAIAAVTAASAAGLPPPAHITTIDPTVLVGAALVDHLRSIHQTYATHIKLMGERLLKLQALLRRYRALGAFVAPLESGLEECHRALANLTRYLCPTEAGTSARAPGDFQPPGSPIVAPAGVTAHPSPVADTLPFLCQTLDQVLMLPLQYLSRLVVLVGEIAHHTPKAHADHSPLRSVLSKLELLTASMQSIRPAALQVYTPELAFDPLLIRHLCNPPAPTGRSPSPTAGAGPSGRPAPPRASLRVVADGSDAGRIVLASLLVEDITPRPVHTPGTMAARPVAVSPAAGSLSPFVRRMSLVESPTGFGLSASPGASPVGTPPSFGGSLSASLTSLPVAGHLGVASPLASGPGSASQSLSAFPAASNGSLDSSHSGSASGLSPPLLAVGSGDLASSRARPVRLTLYNDGLLLSSPVSGAGGGLAAGGSATDIQRPAGALSGPGALHQMEAFIPLRHLSVMLNPAEGEDALALVAPGCFLTGQPLSPPLIAMLADMLGQAGGSSTGGQLQGYSRRVFRALTGPTAGSSLAASLTELLGAQRPDADGGLALPSALPSALPMSGPVKGISRVTSEASLSSLSEASQNAPASDAAPMPAARPAPLMIGSMSASSLSCLQRIQRGDELAAAVDAEVVRSAVTGTGPSAPERGLFRLFAIFLTQCQRHVDRAAPAFQIRRSSGLSTRLASLGGRTSSTNQLNSGHLATATSSSSSSSSSSSGPLAVPAGHGSSASLSLSPNVSPFSSSSSIPMAAAVSGEEKMATSPGASRLLGEPSEVRLLFFHAAQLGSQRTTVAMPIAPPPGLWDAQTPSSPAPGHFPRADSGMLASPLSEHGAAFSVDGTPDTAPLSPFSFAPPAWPPGRFGLRESFSQPDLQDAGAPDTLSSGSAIRPPTLAHARADQPDCLAAFLTLLAPEGDHSNRARPIVAQLPKTRSGMPRRAPSSGSLAGPVDLAPGSPGEALTASMLSTSPAGGGSSTGPAPMSPGGIIADGPGGGVEPSSGSSAPVQQLNALPPLPLGLVRHVLDSALSIDERLIGLLLSPHSARLLEGERLARLLDVGGPLAGQPPGPAPTRPLSILLFEDLLASQLSSSGSGRSASSVSLTATMGLSSPAPRLGSGGGSGSTGSLKQLPALSSSSSSGFLVNSSSGTLRRQAGGAPTSGLTLYALAVDMLAAGPGSMAGATPGGPDPAASPVLEAYRGLLLGEHSSENVDFWLAVIAFDLDPTLEKMSRICSHFILPAASQEVNLSLPCRRATLDMCLLATDIARSEYYFRLVGGANGGSQDWGITSREDAAHYSQALARMVAEAESASSREVSPHLPAVGEAAGPLAAPATESGGFMRVRSRSRSASSSSADGAPGAAALAEAAASRRTFAWRPEGMTDQSPYWRLVLSDVPASMPMPRGLFSDAQSETLRLMVGDSFPRFLNALAGSRHNRRSG